MIYISYLVHNNRGSFENENLTLFFIDIEIPVNEVQNQTARCV
jgi:hypothetical protein